MHSNNQSLSLESRVNTFVFIICTCSADMQYCSPDVSAGIGGEKPDPVEVCEQVLLLSLIEVSDLQSICD